MHSLLFQLLAGCLLTLLGRTVWASEYDPVLIPGASAIHGRVEGKSVCARGENQVWISRGKELLYQATVPAGSTFEFYVRPGAIEYV